MISNIFVDATLPRFLCVTLRTDVVLKQLPGALSKVEYEPVVAPSRCLTDSKISPQKAKSTTPRDAGGTVRVVNCRRCPPCSVRHPPPRLPACEHTFLLVKFVFSLAFTLRAYLLEYCLFLTLLGLQYHFRNKSLKFQVLSTHNGSASLKMVECCHAFLPAFLPAFLFFFSFLFLFLFIFFSFFLSFALFSLDKT